MPFLELIASKDEVDGGKESDGQPVGSWNLISPAIALYPIFYIDVSMNGLCLKALIRTEVVTSATSGPKPTCGLECELKAIFARARIRPKFVLDGLGDGSLVVGVVGLGGELDVHS